MDDPESVDATGLSDVTVFKDADGNVIGALGIEEDDNGGLSATFGTIDIDAMLGVDDPDIAQKVRELFALADPADVAFFQEKPAKLLEFTMSGEIGFGRWGDGRFFSISENDDDPSNVDELTGNQSLHFIFGPAYADNDMPSTGTATYNFFGGTDSTSVSGATIGNGVTSGSIFVDFSGFASINMNVDHNGDTFLVNGGLALNGAEIYDDGTVSAMNLSMTNCYPGCQTFIDGGFAGPANASGQPKHIGIEYDIQAPDVITGVAAFGNP